MKQLVVLAGGRGTRLGDKLGDNPKPMVQVAGRPLLEYHIDLAKRYGFSEVILLIGYRSEKISAHFGDGSEWGISIRNIVESEPLGTAGALVAAAPILAEQFCVLYGDTMLDVDLGRMTSAHHKNRSDFTLFVHPNDHPADSDLVEMGGDGSIHTLHPYPHPPGAYYQNLVNAALYVVSRNCLRPYFGQTRKFDIAKHLIPELLQSRVPVFGYRTREYIKDMGTPTRLQRVEQDILDGKVTRLRQSNPLPAVCLDRDGTLNREKNRITSPDDLELLPGAAEAVRRLNREGWLTPVITNQPVIARGDCSEADLRRIHNRLEWALGNEGAFVDGIYFCPHHPDRGFPGERPELKIECNCRKPKTGLIERATSALNIDLPRSWMLGDTTTDIQCAHNAGLISGLLLTGHAGRDGKYEVRPDFRFRDLTDAVEYILVHYPRMIQQATSIARRLSSGDVVFVVGPLSSSQSTWASCLRIALQQSGLKAAILSFERLATANRDLVVRANDPTKNAQASLDLPVSPDGVTIFDDIPFSLPSDLFNRATLVIYTEQAPTRPDDVAAGKTTMDIAPEIAATLRAQADYILVS